MKKYSLLFSKCKLVLYLDIKLTSFLIDICNISFKYSFYPLLLDRFSERKFISRLVLIEY